VGYGKDHHEAKGKWSKWNKGLDSFDEDISLNFCFVYSLIFIM